MPRENDSVIKRQIERLFDTAMDETLPFDFFKDLDAYVEAILKVPSLKKEVDEQLQKRNALYDKIIEAEKKIVQEMQAAMEKLLAYIEDHKIDTRNFDRIMTQHWSPSQDIITEFKEYENKERSRGGHDSDRLEEYLFDLAVNLRRQKHEAAVAEFARSDKEYQDYYSRSGKPGPSGNVYGTFTFSDTLPEKMRLKNLLENEQGFKPWSAFESLLQFRCAYNYAASNISMDNISEGIIQRPLRTEDLTDIMFMIKDLYFLRDENKDTELHRRELDKLNLSDFKRILRTVHNRFMSIIEAQRSETGEKSTIRIYLTESGDLYKQPKEKYCYEMGQNSDRHKIVKFLAENKGYQKTNSILATVPNKKDESAVSSEIRKIRTLTAGKLKIDSFIKGRKGSGYQINPKYTIIFQ